MGHYLQEELYGLLKKDERIFEFIQEGSLDGLWYWDIENPENEWMNSRFWEILGYKAEEMPHLTSAWQNVINPDDLEIALKNLDKHIADPKHPYDQIVRYKHKDGSIVWIRCRGLAIRDDDGKAFRMLGAHQDVSALKRIEIKLQEEKNAVTQNIEKYKAIYDNAPLAFQSLNEDGNIIEINPKWLEVLGYEKEEVIGRWFGDFLAPDYVSHFKENFPRFKKQGFIKDVQFRMERKSGEYIYVSFEGCIGTKKNGEFAQTYCTFKDISKEKEIEGKLRDREEQYRILFEKSATGVARVSIDGTFLQINQKFCKIIGYNCEELLQMNFADITHPEDLDIDMNYINQVLSGEIDEYSIDKRYVHKDKHDVWVRMSSNVIRKANGDAEYAIATIMDISNEKIAELELKKSEEKYRFLAEKTSDLILLHDPNGNFSYISPNVFILTGYTAEEYSKFGPLDNIVPEDRLYLSTNIDLLKEGIEEVATEYRVYHKSGTIVWIQSRTKAIYNEEGQVSSFMTTSSNIDERKKASFELKERERKFRILFHDSPAAVYETDTHGKCILVNKKWQEFSGLTLDEAKGDNWINAIHEDDRKMVADDWNKYAVSPGEWKNEYRFCDKNGKITWVQGVAKAIFDENKNITGYIGTNIDITERKKNTELIDAFFEQPTNIHLISSVEGKILRVNNGWTKILGYNKEDILDTISIDLVHPDDIPSTLAVMLSFDRKKETFYFENRYLHKEGHYITLAWYAKVSEHDNLIHAVAHDITERKLAENRLKESEERLSLTTEGVNLGLWDWEIETGELICNNNWYELKGYEPYEILPDIAWWQEQVHPDDRERVELLLDDHFEGNTELYEAEFRVKNKIGEWIWIADKGKVIERDLYGKPKRICGIHIDIRERKHAESLIVESNREYESLNEELLKTNEELSVSNIKAQEANRLKTEFLHNMSHEIRTPMNGIMGFSKLLCENDTSEEKRDYYASIILNSGNQLLRVIDDILEISTLETKHIKLSNETFYLNDFMMEMFSIFDIKAKERKIHLYIQMPLKDKDSQIITDRSKLNKVISNLLENALKFTNEGYVELRYSIKGSELVLYVKDTGIGISSQNTDKIFERFSQEDKDIASSHGGLGLGLSISKENTQLLGGYIQVESEKGKGSTFIVTIPYHAVKSNNSRDTNDTTKKTESYTVLIAEDEEVNYLYLQTLLEQIDGVEISILHAKNGKEAVEIVLDKKHIDLVLMDIKMPIMNGYEATKKIKEVFPDLPLIAQTAYSTEADRALAFESGCDDFISKPIKQEMIADKIRTVLKV